MDGITDREFNETTSTTFIATATSSETIVPQSLPMFMRLLFIFIAVLGITGNGLVLGVFYKVPELKVFTNILIGHQSLVDFISSCLLLLTFVPDPLNLQALLLNQLGLANFICKLWANEFFFWAVIKVSTVNLIFITLERYLAVLHPLAYRMKASKRTAKYVCVLAWIVGILMVIYRPFTHTISDEGICTQDRLSSGTRYVLAVLEFMFALGIPVIVMVFVYVSIIRALRPSKQPGSVSNQDSRAGNMHVRPAETVQSAKERSRKNVLTTLFIVSLTYTICWTPDMILYFHHSVVTPHDWTEPFHRFAILLASSNVCVNPIIYTMKYKSFQNGLKRIMGASRVTSLAYPVISRPRELNDRQFSGRHIL